MEEKTAPERPSDLLEVTQLVQAPGSQLIVLQGMFVQSDRDFWVLEVDTQLGHLVILGLPFSCL